MTVKEQILHYAKKSGLDHIITPDFVNSLRFYDEEKEDLISITYLAHVERCYINTAILGGWMGKNIIEMKYFLDGQRTRIDRSYVTYEYNELTDQYKAVKEHIFYD